MTRPFPFPDEASSNRYARELTSILNELRLILPGGQMLFGFMLVAPFSDRFNRVTTPTDRAIFFVGFLLCTLACAFLIAPSVYHRLHWRREVEDKEQMLRYMSHAAVFGAGFVALAMTFVIYVITHVLIGRLAGIATTVVTGLGFFGLWFLYPLLHRAAEPEKPPIAVGTSSLPADEKPTAGTPTA